MRDDSKFTPVASLVNTGSTSGRTGLRNAIVRTLVAFALVGILVPRGPTRAADDVVPGHVVVARSSNDALVLWDMTAEVAALVRDRTSDDVANARIERDALRVLARSIQRLPHAKTITIRAIYNKTGDVSPTYGAATFLGVERYATITMDAGAARSDRDGWRELGATAPIPAWIAFKIVGALPPR